MGTSSDHAMAREIFFEHWGFIPPWRCFFCGRPVEQRRGQTPWSLQVHHLDRDSTNNNPENLAPSHFRCHHDWHRNPYEITPFNDERYDHDA